MKKKKWVRHVYLVPFFYFIWRKYCTVRILLQSYMRHDMMKFGIFEKRRHYNVGFLIFSHIFPCTVLIVICIHWTCITSVHSYWMRTWRQRSLVLSCVPELLISSSPTTNMFSSQRTNSESCVKKRARRQRRNYLVIETLSPWTRSWRFWGNGFRWEVTKGKSSPRTKFTCLPYTIHIAIEPIHSTIRLSPDFLQYTIKMKRGIGKRNSDSVLRHVRWIGHLRLSPVEKRVAYHGA